MTTSLVDLTIDDVEYGFPGKICGYKQGHAMSCVIYRWLSHLQRIFKLAMFNSVNEVRGSAQQLTTDKATLQAEGRWRATISL